MARIGRTLGFRPEIVRIEDGDADTMSVPTSTPDPQRPMRDWDEQEFRLPYDSDRQRRWAHTKRGKKALGAAKVAEYDRASKGMSLPERKSPRKPKRARKP